MEGPESAPYAGVEQRGGDSSLILLRVGACADELRLMVYVSWVGGARVAAGTSLGVVWGRHPHPHLDA